MRSENGKIPGGGSKTLPCEDMHGLQCKECAQSDTMQEMRVEGFENEIQSPREVNRFGLYRIFNAGRIKRLERRLSEPEDEK